LEREPKLHACHSQDAALEISDDDARLLKEILESEISDMSPEIADTDNPTYRRELKEKREQMRALLGKVQQA